MVIHNFEIFGAPQAVVDHYFAQATSPQERGFGMWKKNRVSSLTYVNRLRDQDQRGAVSYLSEGYH